MNIPGLPPSAVPSQRDVTLRPDLRRTPAGVERPGMERTAPPALRQQPPVAGGATAQGTVPAEPPKGTDPALWSVLTSEERQFFAKTAAMGPLTYGRIKEAIAPAPPAARGVRLDIRA